MFTVREQPFQSHNPERGGGKQLYLNRLCYTQRERERREEHTAFIPISTHEMKQWARNGNIIFITFN